MGETLRLVAVTPLERAPSALTGRDSVYLKREDVRELGAFKWRGALPALERYRRDGAAGVVTASTGNHGAATAWAAEQLGLDAIVYVPEGASETKLEKLSAFGAELVVTGADLDEAKEQAVAHAEQVGLPFFEDGAEPAQLGGYAAIGDEILDQLHEEPATVVVPVGNGALLAGVGRALGWRSPETRRIGVVSSGAPVMAQSWRSGRPVHSDLCDTIADGLAVRVAIPQAVEWLLEAADAMLEVSEAEIAAAVVALDDAGIRAEAAAAAALAALPYVEADGAIVLVITGGNIDDELLARCRAARDSLSDCPLVRSVSDQEGP
jgi:threonine dehydratase